MQLAALDSHMHILCTHIILQTHLATCVELNCTDWLFPGNSMVMPHFHSSKLWNISRNYIGPSWPGLGLGTSIISQTVSTEWTFRGSHCLSSYTYAYSMYMWLYSGALEGRIFIHVRGKKNHQNPSQSTHAKSPRTHRFHHLIYIMKGSTNNYHSPWVLFHICFLLPARAFQIYTVAYTEQGFWRLCDPCVLLFQFFE